MNERLTTALAQYLLLNSLGACVPQSRITIINDEEFKVNADNGDFFFSYINGDIKEVER